ncbi:MAG: DUF3365 domain-containing protein [Thiobacillaceae bacterium]
MKFSVTSALITAAVIVAACGTPNSVPKTPDAKAIDETRATAARLVAELGGKLKGEINAHGPASAIDVCSRIAPQIAERLANETGWQVGRIGTRVRNPLNSPNAWQQAALDEFAVRMARGEKLDGMETWKVVDEDGKATLQYAKAIGVQPLCLTCHGTPDDIPDDVKSRLKADYPNDKAVGYHLGELRGAVVISRPL